MRIMERPAGIKVASGLMVLSAIAQLALIMVSPALSWTGPKPAPAWTQSVSVAILLLEMVAVWFFWQGRNWARLLVISMSAVCVARLLQFGEIWSRSHTYGCLVAANALLGIALGGYLATSTGSAWFCSRPEAEGLGSST